MCRITDVFSVSIVSGWIFDHQSAIVSMFIFSISGNLERVALYDRLDIDNARKIESFCYITLIFVCK